MRLVISGELNVNINKIQKINKIRCKYVMCFYVVSVILYIHILYLLYLYFLQNRQLLMIFIMKLMIVIKVYVGGVRPLLGTYQ